MTTTPTPKGLILLSHDVHWPIPDAQMLEALEPGLLPLPRHVVGLTAMRVTIEEASTANWELLRRAQDDQIAGRLRPLLQQHADYRLCYFGAAPIPLAIHLGAAIGGWADPAIFLRDHVHRDWRWRALGDGGQPAAVLVRGVPTEVVHVEGDVVFRVASSHPVHVQSTRDAVPLALAEVDVTLDPISEDPFHDPSEIDRLAHCFKDALDQTLRMRPGTRLVHLFASVQVGVAFALGLQLRASLHPPVQTYQFALTRTPHQLPALRLPGDTARMPSPPVAREEPPAATEGRPPSNTAPHVALLSAPADSAVLDELHNHLRPLEESGFLHCRRLDDVIAGSDHEAEIARRLDSADLVVVLLSSDLLSADAQLRRIARAEAAAKAPTIIPVIARACLWRESPLGRLAPLPPDARPIEEHENRDSALLLVAQGIRRVAESRAVQPSRM